MSSAVSFALGLGTATVVTFMVCQKLTDRTDLFRSSIEALKDKETYTNKKIALLLGDNKILKESKYLISAQSFYAQSLERISKAIDSLFSSKN
mmetsp:Transcript_36220/g.36898  ORF Transcript_36220/g.36898 Transcript_36220/m.36898 type:complete len:93 (+) Transcript_36220:90-368(+)